MVAFEHKRSVSRALMSAKPVPQRRAVSRTAGATVQRASSCACGGHCPRCQAQSTLTVGAPDDRYEREADRVADLVMSGRSGGPVEEHADGSRPALHRKVLGPGEEYDSVAPPQEAIGGLPLDLEEPVEEVQRSAIGPAGTVTAQYEHSLNSAIQGGGQRLPGETRSQMESSLGWDLSAVRVHTDARASSLASDINARAFTLGHDIFFGESQYAPSTSAGQRLLAHELTHVMQQSDGRLSRQVRRATLCSAYPGYDTSVARRTYNCAGLALRTYLFTSPPSAVYADIAANFTNPESPVGNCQAGAVKFWLWQYDIRTEDDLGNVVNPTWRDFHIVGGRMDGQGTDPTNVYSKNGGRPVHGPGTGPSFRPATRDRALDIDDNPGNAPNGRPLFKVRSNMTEEISCAGCF